VTLTVKHKDDRYGDGKYLILNAWFDWDGNGDWKGQFTCPGGPANEHIIWLDARPSIGVNTTFPHCNFMVDPSDWEGSENARQTYTLKFRVPPDDKLTRGRLWSRFRLEYDDTSVEGWPDSSLVFNGTELGFAAFGEVEDYCSRVDYGDAKDEPYPTKRANNGAHHLDGCKEWLGSAVSGELDAVDPRDSDGLENLKPHDTDNNDDGVVLHPPFVRQCQIGVVEVTLTVFNKDYPWTVPPDTFRYADNRQLFFRGWVDWENDGDWDDWYQCVEPNDASDHLRWLGVEPHDSSVLCDFPSFEFRVDPRLWPGEAGTISRTYKLSYLIPPTVSRTLWSRFRLEYHGYPPFYYVPNGTYQGLATFGEVEDYFLGKSNVTIPNTDTCVNPGDYVCLPILLDNNSTPFGGFELAVEFEYTSMTFVSAEPAELMEGFEFFTYRLLPCPACGCCKYKILLYGQYDMPNGVENVGEPIPMTSEDEYRELVNLCFVVNNDENLRGLKIPVCWGWEGTVVNDTLVEDWNCQENTFSSWSGDTLYTSNLVCQFYEEVCDDPTDRIVPGVSFQSDVCYDNCGGVDVCPAGPGECKRGDVNYNTLTYEVADAVLFASYFVEGTSVFRYDEAYQICATDVNADGRTLTLSDLVYLIRVILHDAVAIPKLTPSDEVANVIVSGRTISIQCAAPVGAILLEFDAAVNPTLLADMEMVNKDNKVLVWSSKGKSFNTAEVLSFEGDAELATATAVDRDSRELSTNITGKVAPLTFALHPAYPNPFNPFTNLSFTLPEDVNYSLKIYNVTGQLVRTYEGMGSVGLNAINWDSKDNAGVEVASGVYFYKLTAADFSATEKMVMMK
jgi:hypothetical protein